MITDLLKLDYFCANPYDRSVRWQKSRAIAFSLAQVAITFANASRLCGAIAPQKNIHIAPFSERKAERSPIFPIETTPLQANAIP
jgi:hypothetical protein